MTDGTPRPERDIDDGTARTERSARAAADWREAIVTRGSQLASDPAAYSARPPRMAGDLSRRRLVFGSFWLGLLATVVGSLGGFLGFFYPRNVRGFGGAVSAGNVRDVPSGGEPAVFRSGQFLLTNLSPDETRPGGSGEGSGLLALWWKCPHLGCTVPWRGSFDFAGDSGGWYRCPCHGSTYTKAGVRVFGPAPRSMDTMEVEIGGTGNITVHSGRITAGGPDNPTRAVQHPLLPT